MAGGTHIFDMIKRLKENENLKKKNYFKSVRGKKSSGDELTDPIHASEETLRQIRAEARDNQRKENKRLITILVVSIILVFVLLIALLRLISEINFFIGVVT